MCIYIHLYVKVIGAKIGSIKKGEINRSKQNRYGYNSKTIFAQYQYNV